MLLALKPLACITFICLPLLLFLLAPRKTCNFHNHLLPYENPPDHQRPPMERRPTDHSLTCHGRRIYVHKLPPNFNADLLRQCRYGLTSWLNFCPHIARHGLGEPVRDQQAALLQVSTTNSNLNSSVMQSPDRKPKRKMLLDHASIHQYVMQPKASNIADMVHGHSQALELHRTDPYMLEVIFHHRLLHYPCLTSDPDLADAFFLPYYAGLDALPYLYKQEKDKPKLRHGSKLVSWLQNDSIARDKWNRYGGKDHFLIMSRTPWDFGIGASNWGTGIFHIPEYDNMTLLLIEKQGWMPNQHAIPYPTSFHPQSSASLHAWMQSARINKRTFLFAFAGSIRPALMKGGIRDALLEQCASSEKCKLLDCKRLKCSHNPQPIMSTFLDSQFCLQPRGDTPTRRSLFDSLIAGCIPVIFHNDTAYTQYEWHLPQDGHTWSVYIDEEEIRKGAIVEEVLMAYKQDQIEQMRNALIAFMPRLVYAGDGGEGRGSLERQQREEDAFDVSVREVLKLVAEKKGTK